MDQFIVTVTGFFPTIEQAVDSLYVNHGRYTVFARSSSDAARAAIKHTPLAGLVTRYRSINHETMGNVFEYVLYAGSRSIGSVYVRGV